MSDIAAQALAIANLKARYCAVADRAAHDPGGARRAFQALFAPDVLADYGYGELAGVEAAAEFMCTSIPGNSEWMIHMLHSPQLDVDGAIARGQWTVMVHSKPRDGGAVAVVIGRYNDEFRRTDQGWRISRIGFTQLA